MGMASSPVLPLPGSRHVVPPLIFCYLAYITEILLARSKRVTTKIHGIKIEKIRIPSNHHLILIPLNPAQNRCELSWQCSIFEWSIARLPAHHACPIKFPFLEHSASLAHARWAHPFAS